MSRSVPMVKKVSLLLENIFKNIMEPELLSSFINTFNKRPYVFVMIVYYMIVAKSCVNTKFMFSYMIFGYLVALIAEYLSITSDVIPVFGTYYYIYESL